MKTDHAIDQSGKVVNAVKVMGAIEVLDDACIAQIAG